MTAIIRANLDVEARWAGATLKPAIAQRVSAYAALAAVLAPAGAEVEVWAPAAVDPARLRPTAGWRPPVMRVGTPARCDHGWADPGPIGQAANDRRFALQLAEELRIGLPGARAITNLEELGLAGPWVCKLPWTAAGRDRCRGEATPTAEQRVYLGRLLAKVGALVVEPRRDRIVDAAQCGSVDAAGAVTLRAPHSLLVDARGAFGGIDLAAPSLEDSERDRLAATARAAGAALARLGFVGPFAVDAFAYRERGTGARRFHPLCELNARVTFGTLAHLLGERLGIARLGFTAPAPADATVLVALADGAIAWVR